MIAVGTRPPRLTVTSVSTGKVDAGAIVTWIGETFVDRIGCWCYDDPSTTAAVAVAASVDTAVVSRIHILAAESVARISAELVLHPIVSLPMVGIATIPELGPRFAGNSSPLHPWRDLVGTVKWKIHVHSRRVEVGRRMAIVDNLVSKRNIWIRQALFLFEL